ncbi:MAG: DUF5777 family beta-barrel protein [Bacteroidota bacterium]|mgnify:FL=1|nr:DUF5777 family beta-barrel protein [Bacteroidota bacterium]MDX5405394.1 DUF5777 family beta-barrel protein [Bacteroidota bacterium]MDX5448976.1 DUF5777 family beta-barrel protein [Bacteroidota bacterium]
MKIWYQPLLGLFLFCASLPSFAQEEDDLFDILDEEQPTTYASATFKGTRIINLQSNELPAQGVLQFMISHRFGPVNDDFLYNFFGLDVAQIRLGLDYSPLPWLNVGIGRSSATKTYDGFAKIRILRQSQGGRNFPLSVVWYSSMNYTTLKWTDDLPHNESDRLSYVHQLILARKFNESISFELVPSYTHFNLVETNEQPNDIFSLGFGGRVKITNRVALTAEYMLQMPPNTYLDNGQLVEYNNALSVGVDIETGGHVFQLHVTNSRSLADPFWMNRTPGSWGNGDIYFGFNISRVFTLVKPKMPESQF